MITEIFAIYDVKADQFSPPVFIKNLDVLKRSLRKMVNDPGSQFSECPDDFLLYRCGEFDDITGEFTCGVKEFEFCLSELFEKDD